jgi:hypothetical protein
MANVLLSSKGSTMKFKRLAVFLLLTVTVNVLAACGEKNGTGSTVANDSAFSVFSQEIHLNNPFPQILKSQSVKIPVSVRNTSGFTWPALGENAVHLAYHWLDKSGNPVIFDGERTHLIQDLPVGGTATLDATIIAPSLPGDYTLRLTFVQEGIAWFNDRGAMAVDLPVKVEDK